MKIFLMSDIEGVSGVIKFDDWAVPGGRYYEEGKALLTLELNAAIDGFFAAGATEVVVVDGHGHGGVTPQLLDRRALFLRGPVPGPYPFMLDGSFDAMAWVGQHAKAGTPLAHMAHTGGFNVVDYRINGLSIGEFGQMALCGAELGVRSIFGAGDQAFTEEARALIAGIETVSVKRGIMPGTGDECNEKEYQYRNDGAIHMHAERARELIRAGAERALTRFKEDREQFALLSIQPPYRREIDFRASEEKMPYSVSNEHPNSIIALLNGQSE